MNTNSSLEQKTLLASKLVTAVEALKEEFSLLEVHALRCMQEVFHDN